MSCRKPVFTGLCTALVTPFYDSGGLDTAKFSTLIDRQISAGAQAICVCGTTGEAATMTASERMEAISFCCQHADHRIKVIAGTGSNSTSDTIYLCKQAQAVGADALLVVTPYYNKPTQTGLQLHYAAVTEQTDLPVIAYNVPSRTGVSFTAETYRQLSENPGINGVKEASGDFGLLSDTRRYCGEDFYIWSGNDDQVVPMMALGSVGVISVAGNLIPNEMAQLTSLCEQGDFRAASALQLKLMGLIRSLFCESNPIPIKEAMNLAGTDVGPVRLPLSRISQTHLELLKQEMRGLNLIK